MTTVFNDPLIRLLGDWAAGLNVFSILFRIALSVLLSAIIGCERSSKRHSAGLRTFILAGMACAVAMLIDMYLLSYTGAAVSLCAAAAIISTAMISGNSILFSSRNQIKGLTTSAGLWACGIVGLTAGAGLYTVTLVAFAALLCILACFPRIEIALKNRSNHFEIHLELTNRQDLQKFIATLRQLGLRVDDIELDSAYLGSGLSVYSITLTILSMELKQYKTHGEIIKALESLDYIYHIAEMN